MEPTYLTFVQEVRDHILQSRYRAARLVNRELLLLYYAVGKRLSEKVTAEKWGTKVIEQLSADLQREVPGLRGFSYRNLKNMRQFADEYADLIGQLLTALIQSIDNEKIIIGQLLTAQLTDADLNVFLSASFTHHTLLLNRCRAWPERWFYLQKLVDNQWTIEMLDWQIRAKAYEKRDQTLTNNFAATLPSTIRYTALQAFKDEYLSTLLTSRPTTNGSLTSEQVK